ncbi:MAG: 2-hydroxyglutaryl-CoA dehydratase [Peptostreptococcaceae bacterium]|nr:2-hydroxyglutaryl-CoA dehydratase [Peptostreptococcaceae bacterium]
MYLGIDIGYSSSKAVVIDSSKRIKGMAIVNLGTESNGFDLAVKQALEQAKIRRADIKKCVVTGRGRMIYDGADKQITEISCHVIGARHLIPDVRTIIDIGGQDAKVIKLSSNGMVENFAMNEKSATGTGKFLEVMARVLECKLNQLSQLAEKGEKAVVVIKVSTMFSESEIISQLIAGEKTEDIALGVNKSIAERIAGLCKAVKIEPTVTMTGGVALNTNVVDCIENQLGEKIVRLDNPQIMGALGAAIYAVNMDK